MNPIRCQWATTHPLCQEYHDTEWGVPCHADHSLFELLVLEGMQAGLSWLTVLKKREAYRQALQGFNPHLIAEYTEEDKARLLANPGIIRHRLKIDSIISNAKAFLEVQKSHGSFDAYLWKFVNGRPICSEWAHQQDVPTQTDLSDRLSRDLKKRGFRFVGSTICYSYLQAVGVVNDHLISCFKKSAVKNT